MRDDSDSGAIGAVVRDDLSEMLDGEAILAPATRAPHHRAAGLSVLLLGGTSADVMLGSFVLSECVEVGRVEVASSVEAAVARLSEGRRFDLILIDSDEETGDLGAVALLLQRASGLEAPALVLLGSRFTRAQRAASPPAGPFSARLAKPLTRGRCHVLFDRLFG